MKLKNYWPTHTEIDACIKNEAETAAESVLLAVHRRVDFLVERSGQETEKSEDQLLTEFLTPNVPSGALIMPILGASGIGKSHVIRWLQAMIQRREDASKYHIIRIPKTANLRKVVELILEPLKHNSNYEKIRGDLADAVQNVTEQELITTFVAELTNEIRAYGEQARTQLDSADRELKRKLRKEIGFSDNLPFLFTDSELQAYFNESIFSRLTKRSFSGGTSDEDFDELPQFKTTDFDFPDTVSISKCARTVFSYISQNIAISDNTNKNSIVEFLNGHQLIDRALKRAYKFNGDFGGKTLEELILDIRDELFKEGEELVLLIEDFAALTGFQDTLLNVAIQEGQVDGAQVRATMRTAIAVTDGYQLTDTVSTRAKSRWRIRSRAFEHNEQIVDEIADMVGAYLNAARWGKAKLDEMYLNKSNKKDWAGIYRDESLTDEEDELLEAFGKSRSDFFLFPFNRNAIKVLANSYLRDRTGSLVFTPRELINQIIRPTLLARDLYGNGQFPIVYENVRPKTGISLFVNNIPGDEPLKDRAKGLLAIWGGDPETAKDITGLTPAIFEAFNIPISNVSDVIKSAPVAPASVNPTATLEAQKQEVIAPPNKSAETDAGMMSWKKTLEKWASGERLAQQHANNLRNWIGEAVSRHIQWDTTGIPKPNNKPRFSIANADGEGTGGDKIIICVNNADNEGRFRAAFVALYRFNKNSYSWDYHSGETDYENLIEVIERVAAEWLKLLEVRQLETISVLSRHLRLQSRLLGTSPPQSLKPYDKLIETLFFDVPVDAVQRQYDQEWQRLSDFITQDRSGDASWRGQIKSELLKNIASYQGERGDTPQSIDFSKLITAFGTKVEGQEASKVTPKLREYFLNFNERKVLQVARILKNKLTVDYDLIAQKIGDAEHFDKGKFISSLETLKEKLMAIGCFPNVADGFDIKLYDFNQKLSELHNVSISSTIKALEKIKKAELTPEKNAGALNELGALDFSMIAYVTDVFKQSELLCNFGQTKIDHKKQLTAGQDLNSMKTEIISILSWLRELR